MYMLFDDRVILKSHYITNLIYGRPSILGKSRGVDTTFPRLTRPVILSKGCVVAEEGF